MSHPSRPTVIAVNQVAFDVFLEDLGANVVASSSFNLHEAYYPHEIWGSLSLYQAITDGYLLINDGSQLLNTAQSQRFIEIGLSHAVINTGTSLDQQIPKFSGTTGKVVVPSAITINGSDQLNMGGARILNVGAPTVSSDAVNKAYVDGLMNGQDWKESVQAATTGPITLFDSQTIDGVAVVAGQRVLVKDQANPIDNGIYVVVEDGYWTRSTDLIVGNGAAGVVVVAEAGTANADRGFICINNIGSDVVGTDGLTFTYHFNSSLATIAPLDVDTAAAAVGTSSRAAREDHKHDIATASAGAIAIGDVSSEGSALSLARSDHTHAVASAAPVAVGTANSEGVATTFSRSDHVHDVPFSAVQNALSEADGYISVNGQVISNVATPVLGGDAANKAYVDGYVSSMLSSTLTNIAPLDVDAGPASVGTGLYAAREDHKHDVLTAAPTVGIGGGNLEGTSNALARADHNHALRELGGADLTLGSIADGQMVYRDGYTLKGGTRLYAPSATDPVTPAPTGGDRYYNTTLNLWMFYDSSRSKWLSEETFEISVGRNGATNAGTYYRGPDSRVLSATSGWLAPFNGTVIGLAYTRSDTDAATFEVTADGTNVATVASSAVEGRNNALNGDFAQDVVLACRNAAAGNDTSNVIASIRIKWRA